jgi:hypothetical protein
MPSLKYSTRETQQITKLVKDQLLKLGLSHGVFNVEFIDTPLGFKIIDVNPRPGGYYINAYIRYLYGIDTFKAETILNSRFPLSILPLSLRIYLEGTAIYDRQDIGPCDFVVPLDKPEVSANPVDMIACSTNVIHS